MSPRQRTGRKLFKSFLPVALLLLLAVVGLTGWIVYRAAHPPRRPYLITPEQFGRQFSDRGFRATGETWRNADGTAARGWLLRGTAGTPAVVLLHRYGADRSWLFNLGVKINETTNYTILWPDLRGHGENPPVASSSFGVREADDVLSALDYLRTLRAGHDQPLVGESLGFYGVEMGAYAALAAATRNRDVRALALDSVPGSPDTILNTAVETLTGMNNSLLQMLAQGGVRIYLLGNYRNVPACAIAANLRDHRVLLLSGEEAGGLRDATTQLVRCFPNQSNIELRNDLPLTGLNAGSATGQQGELYDRLVIDFFDRALRDLP